MNCLLVEIVFEINFIQKGKKQLLSLKRSGEKRSLQSYLYVYLLSIQSRRVKHMTTVSLHEAERGQISK